MVIKGPEGKCIFGMVKVGEKGQVVIPEEAREMFNIKAGDPLMMVGDHQSGIAIITSEMLTQMFLGLMKQTSEGEQQ